METKNILITMKNGDQIKAELYPEIAPEISILFTQIF